MKKLFFISTVLVFLLVWFALNLEHDDSDSRSGSSELSGSDTQNPVVVTEKPAQGVNHSHSNKSINDVNGFSQQLLDLGFGANGGRPSVRFDQIRELAAIDSAKALEEIEKLANDPDEHYLELLELDYQCSGLLNVQSQIEEILVNLPFEKALWESGRCLRLGTDIDPFYTYLDLARKGNKLAQFNLDAELYKAIDRGVVNVLLFPLEYNELRNESLMYLKSFSSQGVSLASLKLSREFLNDQKLFPKDRVLSYFYLSLFEKQHPLRNEFPWNDCFHDGDACKSPYALYQTFTDDEKRRADRLMDQISG